MTTLFEPFKLRGTTLRNRIGVSPMCRYSSVDGFADDWHLVHLGSRALREAWPQDKPLTVRLSCTDWVDGGWDLDQSVAFSGLLKEAGVDLIDCSSGGTVPHVKIPVAPGYQVPFSARIKEDAGIATSAVGLIACPDQAEEIIAKGQADLVFLAREFLRDPYWPLRHGRFVAGEVAARTPGGICPGFFLNRAGQGDAYGRWIPDDSLLIPPLYREMNLSRWFPCRGPY